MHSWISFMPFHTVEYVSSIAFNIVPPYYCLVLRHSWSKTIHFFKAQLVAPALAALNIFLRSLNIVSLSLTQLCLPTIFSDNKTLRPLGHAATYEVDRNFICSYAATRPLGYAAMTLKLWNRHSLILLPSINTIFWHQIPTLTHTVRRLYAIWHTQISTLLNL